MRKNIPIGYKMIDGKIVLDDKKIELVKNIFKDYLNGVSTDKIAQDLIVKGIPNGNNKISWSYGSVRRILVNIKYLGDTIHPQIIDEKTFQLVQERRKAIATKLDKTPQFNSLKKQAIFSGKLICGECGELYREYVKNTGKVSEIRDWKCKRYICQNKITCRNLFLTRKDIENIFISATNKILSKMWILDKENKKEPLKTTIEIRGGTNSDLRYTEIFNAKISMENILLFRAR